MSNQHVIHTENWWWVKGEWNSKFSKYFETQNQANDYAKWIATNQWWDVILHRKDNNRIRERNTYWKNDPFPPAW